MTVDLLAVAGRQAAVAGLGLLVLYCVPVATITGSIGLVAIAAPAAGLALLLWADQHRGSRRPGRAPRTRFGAGGAGRAAHRRWPPCWPGSSSAPSCRRSPRAR